jgi:hypothetical protein
MFLAWFQTKEETQFGDDLGKFFIERLPVGVQLNDKRFQNKATEVLQKMGTQVDQFKKGRSLNVYKKAKLSNQFRWKLKDAGYSNDYAEELVRWLLLRLG